MQSNVDFSIKNDSSPVTDADLYINSQLCLFIEKNLKIKNIISEENKQLPYKLRSTWKDFWVIDPIDGTKEYLQGNDDYTINLCLFSNKSPIVSFVVVPNASDLYFAHYSRGAYRNNEQITCKELNSSRLKVVASKSHFNEETKSFINDLKQIAQVELINAGSSLKICRVAEGLADIYPRFGPTMEWDTAAADFLLQKAGGSLCTTDFQDYLMYNKKDLMNPYFVALSDMLKHFLKDEFKIK